MSHQWTGPELHRTGRVPDAYNALLLDHVTEFTFYPKMDPDLEPLADFYSFALKVSWRGDGRWAVLDGSSNMRKDGHTTYERLSSSRTDRFLKAYRYSLDDAVAIAQKYVDRKKINGRTAIEWQRHFADEVYRDLD